MPISLPPSLPPPTRSVDVGASIQRGAPASVAKDFASLLGGATTAPSVAPACNLDEAATAVVDPDLERVTEDEVIEKPEAAAFAATWLNVSNPRATGAGGAAEDPDPEGAEEEPEAEETAAHEAGSEDHEDPNLTGKTAKEGEVAMKLRNRSALVAWGASRGSARESSNQTVGSASEEPSAESFDRALDRTEKTSSRAVDRAAIELFPEISGQEVVDRQILEEVGKRDGTAGAEPSPSMNTNLLSEYVDLGTGLSAPVAVTSVASGAEVVASRAPTLQALVEQVGQLTSRLSQSGGGQFNLEWGGAGRESVTVEVALRDGRWHVEFRSANPELTRYLEREWSQTAEARQIVGNREAEVAFKFDDSRDGRRQADRSDLSGAEAQLLRRLREQRYSRRHS